MKVLILTLRGLPAALLGCYGNSWVSTLTLDWLAAEGFLFDQHFACSPRREESWNFWRSGRHRLPDFKGDPAPDSESFANLPACLSQQSIPAILITDHPEQNSSAAWKEVHTTKERDIQEMIETSVKTLTGLKSSEDWLVWLDSQALLPPWEIPEEHLELFFSSGEEEEVPEPSEDPLFFESEPEAVLEPLLDPVTERVTEEEISRLQDTFAARLSAVDEVLTSLLGHLQELQLRDNCWLIITSDAGQTFHGLDLYGKPSSSLSASLMKIPLLISPPGMVEGERIPALTQAIDLMPTLLDLFGLEVPESVQGQSLLGLMKRETEEIHEYICAGAQQGYDIALSLRSPSWSYVFEDGPDLEESRELLFVQPEDRWEVNNVVQVHLTERERFHDVLREVVKQSREPGAFEMPPLESEED